MVSMKIFAVAGALSIGMVTMVQADDRLSEGRWSGRSVLVSEATDAVAQQDHAVPVLTTASLPPRRPKNLAVAPVRQVRTQPVAVVENRPVRVAATVVPPKQPLFWMTVGNGF